MSQLTYFVLNNGHEYVGEVAERSVGNPYVSVDKIKRVDLIRFPAQTPQGFQMMKQVELVPIALSETGLTRLDIHDDDVMVRGIPDKQIEQLYMRVVYGLEPVTAASAGVIAKE